MPELPEVQTTVDGLNRTVRGKTIMTAWLDWLKAIPGLKKSETLTQRMTGRRILGASRRGKNIFIDLDGDETLHVHLKMTGHLLYGRWHMADGRWRATTPGPLRDDPGNSFIRLMITFADKTQLALCDMRRFAKIALYPTQGLEDSREFALLGPDPLSPSFTIKLFSKILFSPTRRPIKQFLLDQTKIAGIGNIYSDEMLWRAGIHPRRLPGSLSLVETRRLHAAMQKVLRKGIGMGGDSDIDFRNIDGERGHFQETHRAYRRNGKPCGKRGCPGLITRIVIGGRSSHFCPAHQK